MKPFNKHNGTSCQIPVLYMGNTKENKNCLLYNHIDMLIAPKNLFFSLIKPLSWFTCKPINANASQMCLQDLFPGSD